MKPIVGEYQSDGLVRLDLRLLAKSMGFTKSAFDQKLSNLGLQQVWSEARRFAHQRGFDREQPLEAEVTDEDLLKAASQLLKPPIRFHSDRD
jgi:hypothetical protein